MTNKPKTPGEVAYIAHAYALVKETGIGTNTWWSSLPGHEVKVWEATARAVQEEQETEAASRLGALQRRLVRWRARDFGSDYDEDFEALIRIVTPFFPVEPTPEAAEGCAEDAGAEPSKSPPPAKR